VVGRDDGAAVTRLAKTKDVLNGQADFTPLRKEETPDPPVIERWTALHECVRQSKVDILKLLIDNGAELEIQDEDGETPTFLLASLFKYSELLVVLLDAGANPNARAGDGWSCLMMAVRARDYETSKALLDAGGNVYLGRDMVGRTALDIIAQQDSGQAATLLKVGESLDEALEKQNILHALLLQYS
jgi:ankyrin repeat protein